MLVSPQRTQRPWQGQVERTAEILPPAYDPSCYLCPGNERAGGRRNPQYESTFVFDNDFPALLPEAAAPSTGTDLLRAEGECGVCRVVCFSPRHDLTLARMSQPEIRRVVNVWAEQVEELGSKDFTHYVQVFENRGAMMGASNPHPHCQIWATQSIPDELVKESSAQAEYQKVHGRCLLCEYAKTEERLKERVVTANDEFLAVVPFWAVWPFETLVIARRHVDGLVALDESQREGLAEILRRVTIRYDNLFKTAFPYSMGFHQVPARSPGSQEWHLHAHFYPPLLRSATVRKFMVGFEMLGMPQRDITAESAAERLREMPEVHYSED